MAKDRRKAASPARRVANAARQMAARQKAARTKVSRTKVSRTKAAPTKAAPTKAAGTPAKSAPRGKAKPPRASRAALAPARGAVRGTALVRGRKRAARPAALPGPLVRLRPDDEPEPHTSSPTAVAAEALRTGVLPSVAPRQNTEDALPHGGKKILVGDPDDDSLGNEYVGEETPGGSTPTPDQSDVDEIGLAYGVKEEDSGELRTSSDLLDRRDRRRRGVVMIRGKI
jgi:hypothetical protein